MSELIATYGTSAMLLGGLGLLAISGPRPLALRLAALGAIAALLPMTYAALASLMSLPKPAGLEWWHAQARQAVVVASEFREDEAIFLWLRLPDAAEPRAYRLPWNRALAEQLQTASRKAEAGGGVVRMRKPFETSLDEQKPKFYAPPPPAAPPKARASAPALQYSRTAAQHR